MANKKRKLDEVVVRRAHCYYMEEEYRTIAIVAKQFGVSPPTLRDSFERYGLERKPQGTRTTTKYKRGKEHGNWSGGRMVVTGGYVRIWIDPNDVFQCMANSKSFVLEHRYVMAKYLGRPLHRWETVHHIDGDREHNDITNLQLRIGNHGPHQAYYCMDCGSDRLSPKEI